MASCPAESEMNGSIGEDVTSINCVSDVVKLATDEIIKILQLDEDELGVQVVTDLLENGRQSLVKHKSDIISRVYNEAMGANDSQLMISLKKYFRTKWEIQYGLSHPWFILFLKQYENWEKHHVYESVLVRTAEYGNKCMKDFPLLSLILQLLFESIHDDCLQESDRIFDDLWATITNDGLQSITNYSAYIINKILTEQLKKESALYEALREYYRPNVFSSLTKSTIPNDQTLYASALDDVVERGWLSDMKSVENEITPRRYQTLLKNLRSFYKKTVADNTDPSGSLAPTPRSNLSLSSENVATGNEQQDNQETKDNESHVSDDSKSSVSNMDIGPIYNPDTIFVNGLPTNISRQRLYDGLRNIFITCGDIENYKETNKLDIWLMPQKGTKFELNGTARVRFKKEESAMKAIAKYNGKQIPGLNNARIGVRLYNDMRQGAVKPEAQERPERDKSVSSDSSMSSAHESNMTGTAMTPLLSKDAIFIVGLPTDMSEQRLFDTLWDEFSTVGSIKIDQPSRKPAIRLFRQAGPASQLTGAGKVTFEHEESVPRAIEKYNGKQLPSLNGRQLFVRRSEERPSTATNRFAPKPSAPRPLLAASMSRPEGQPDGPVSVYWDIENVAIPAQTKAFDVLLRLRKRLMDDRKLREGTFKTYYRHIHAIPTQHRTDLHHANVMVQHIESTKSGAVDRQIHKDLQQFIEQHKVPSTVVLITGDIDLIKDINELRFRHRHYTIIIHNRQAKQELLDTANERIPWEEFVMNQQSHVRKFNCAPNTSNIQSKAAEQASTPRISKLKDQSKKSPSSRQRNLEKTAAPLIDLDVTTPVVETSSSLNLLEWISTVEGVPGENELQLCPEIPETAQKEACVQKKYPKTESRADPQLLDPFTPSTKTLPKPKKKNEPANIEKAFSCSMCDKAFLTDAARVQHEEAKHQTGTLVDISSTLSTDDPHSDSQLPGHDDQSNLATKTTAKDLTGKPSRLTAARLSLLSN